MQNNIISSLAVFCGSSTGNDDSFYNDAFSLGVFLANKNIQVVYGGAKIGLMGAVADGALSQKGVVTGVIPDFLVDKEIAHEGITHLRIVKSMQERKTLMHELSDGAIILPGGFGTMDEMFELLTWGQLGLHKKPIGILNSAGYYDDLISFINKMVNMNLLRQSNREMLLISTNIESLFKQMLTYKPPLKAKWIAKDQI